MTFRLGTVSETRLTVCDLDLARNIRRALELSAVDFGVGETLRAMERQRKLFEAGLSRTLDSHHLPGPDGRANAADLWPWIEGGYRFVEAAGIQVAQAMHRAQAHTKADITWGGVWDRRLAQLDVNDLEGEIEDYVARWRSKHPRPPNHAYGWGPLRDIWHFEVPRG